MHLGDSYFVVTMCQAPLPGPESTVVNEVQGSAKWRTRCVRSQLPSGTQGPAYRRAPARVTNVAQGQEGATKEVIQWMNKEDSRCKVLVLQSVAVSRGRAGRPQQEALQLRASIWS